MMGVNDLAKDENVVSQEETENKTKKCKYFNRGYCKYKLKKCRFSHPKDVCKEYLEDFKCGVKDCPDRHPAVCKWLKSKYGCKRAEECDYLHVTLASDEVERWEHRNMPNMIEYECISCKSSFSDERCVKMHVIKNTKTFFCLNCEDWVKQKHNVYSEGWTLLDQDGFLRRDV